MEGYCSGVPAGTVKVAWNVGDCPLQWGTAYNAGDSFSGWVSTSRITVEEQIVHDAGDNIG